MRVRLREEQAGVPAGETMGDVSKLLCVTGTVGDTSGVPLYQVPLQFTTLPGNIDLLLAFVSGTRSQFWASRTNVCAPHQCVMTGRHNSCAQFHLWVWLRSKGLDEQ